MCRCACEGRGAKAGRTKFPWECWYRQFEVLVLGLAQTDMRRPRPTNGRQPPLSFDDYESGWEVGWIPLCVGLSGGQERLQWLRLLEDRRYRPDRKKGIEFA
jgi:hypothetical protein